jgi:hypothetical protein
MKTIISNILTVLIISAIAISVVCICVTRAVELNDIHTIDKSEYRISEHYITENDTLWELGKKYIQEDDELKAWISAVKELNNIEDSSLRIGDTIKIYIAI